MFEPAARIGCPKKLDDLSASTGSFGGGRAATAEKSKGALKETLGMRHIEARVMALDVYLENMADRIVRCIRDI